MRELLETIAKSLVNEPQKVDVRESKTNYGTVFKLRVAPDDMGRIIGKQGRRAKALRTIMKAVSFRNNTKFILEIVD